MLYLISSALNPIRVLSLKYPEINIPMKANTITNEAPIAILFEKKFLPWIKNPVLIEKNE